MQEHINSLKQLKNYSIKNLNIEVKKSKNKIIFPTGLFSKVVVISDDLYNEVKGEFSKLIFMDLIIKTGKAVHR